MKGEVGRKKGSCRERADTRERRAWVCVCVCIRRRGRQTCRSRNWGKGKRRHREPLGRGEERQLNREDACKLQETRGRQTDKTTLQHLMLGFKERGIISFVKDYVADQNIQTNHQCPPWECVCMRERERMYVSKRT